MLSMSANHALRAPLIMVFNNCTCILPVLMYLFGVSVCGAFPVLIYLSIVACIYIRIDIRSQTALTCGSRVSCHRALSSDKTQEARPGIWNREPSCPYHERTSRMTCP